MRRHWKLLLGILAVIVLIVGVVGYLWLTDLVDPMPETEAALVSDGIVSVETDPWLTFTPTEGSSVGFVFYPGGRVPAQAYAPAMRAIAEAGYVTIVPDMPLGLAVLAPDTADDIIEEHPTVEHWVIGGHSLGGVMAAGYTADHDVIEGLALWASYPADETDLSAAPIQATSVYATEDGLLTTDDIESSRARLPSDTVYVEIDGGNHAGFGWYGVQEGDGVATFSREEQQAQVVQATVDLLEVVEDR